MCPGGSKTGLVEQIITSFMPQTTRHGLKGSCIVKLKYTHDSGKSAGPKRVKAYIRNGSAPKIQK